MHLRFFSDHNSQLVRVVHKFGLIRSHTLFCDSRGQPGESDTALSGCDVHGLVVYPLYGHTFIFNIVLPITSGSAGCEKPTLRKRKARSLHILGYCCPDRGLRRLGFPAAKDGAGRSGSFGNNTVLRPPLNGVHFPGVLGGFHNLVKQVEMI